MIHYRFLQKNVSSQAMNNTLQLPGDLPDSIILEPGFRSRYAEMNEISAM
jgi:hypothetical protein